MEGCNNKLANILSRRPKSYGSTRAQNQSIAALCGNIVPAKDPMESVTTENMKHEKRQPKPPREAVKDEDGICIVKEHGLQIVQSK